MKDDVIPDYNHNDRNHWYIWHVLAYEITEGDFKAIKEAIIERENEHKAIDESKRMFVPFGSDDEMMQPRDLPDSFKNKGHKYIDWDCAMTIWMIVSKYVDLYSKKKID